jgi:hypothetical protein
MRIPVLRGPMQFLQWGVNASRLSVREVAMPLLKSVSDFQKAPSLDNANAVGYHAMRGLAFVAAGVLSGEAINALRQFVTGKSPNDPDWNEIGNAITKGNYENALAWTLQRSIDMMILGGFTGTGGEFYFQTPKLITDPADTRNLKDPLNPPMFGMPEALLAFFTGWNGENGFKALPSPFLVNKLLETISTYRVPEQGLKNFASSLHGANPAIPANPLAQAYAGRNDKSWLMTRQDMYVQANPVAKNKADRHGTRTESMAGRNPFDPIRDQIQDALLSGDSKSARAAAEAYINSFPPSQRVIIRRGVNDSVRQSNPLKPGGSTSAVTQEAFISWARNNLPKDDVARILKISQNYARAADAAGFRVRVPQ